MKTNVEKNKKVVEVEELEVENSVEKKKTSYESVDSFDDIEFEADGFGQSQYSEVFFVKPKTKDKCYFEISQKEGDKFVTEQRTDRNIISGDLIKIETSSYTYENKEIKTLKFHIVRQTKDGNKMLFILNTSYTQVARTIMNCLLSIDEPIKRIGITLFKNSAGFTQVAVTINSKIAKWKYEQKYLKTMVEDVKNKRGEVLNRDYFELDNFLELELLKHLKVWFPEQEFVNFVEEEDKTEDTFGISDEEQTENPTDFFEINETE